MNHVMKLLGAMSLCAGIAACGTATEEPDCVPGPGVICTAFGNGVAALGKDGKGPLEISLYLPQDVTVGPDGRPYIVDWNNHRIRVLEDGLIRTVAGTGFLGDAPDGPATESALNHPTHITFAPDGKMIMSAWHNSKVTEIDLGTGMMRALCGTGARSFGGDGGPAEEAALDLPVATVFDSQGRMLIMDQANQRIRRIELDGTIQTVVGPPADYLPPGVVEVCNEPEGGGEPVCKTCKEEEQDDPDCLPVPTWPMGFAGDGGPATKAFMSQSTAQSAPPHGRLEMGPNDEIYFADTNNHRIRVVVDGIIDTFAGSGPDTFDPSFKGGYDGDGGPANEALLKSPADLAVATDGTVYIADTQNSCVRVVTPDGIIDTYAGICGERGYAGDNGDARDATLNRPYGVALDADGNLYIADTHNNRIRIVYAR